MEFPVPSPASIPHVTEDQFRHAIRRGLGSVILFLRENDARPFYDEIEYAATHDCAYDRQCEPLRAEYMYRVIRLTPDPDYFRDRVVDALLTVGNEQDADHLFELAVHLARDGDQKTRDAIYAKFDRNDSGEHFDGKCQIVQLDGIAGMLHIADRIGADLLSASPTPWEPYNVRSVLEECRDSLGEERTNIALQEAARDNPRIRAYLDAAVKPDPENRWTHHPDRLTQDFSYEYLRRRLDEADDLPSPGFLSKWARRAADPDIENVARDLLAEHDERKLLKMLSVFFRRAFPLDPDRLLALTESSNDRVAHAAYVALEKVSHPRVRQAALDAMKAGRVSGRTIGLFISNYESGDAALIVPQLPSDGSDDFLHWTAFNLIEVFEVNQTKECLDPMIWAYQSTPCSNCRRRAVEVLMAASVLPDWMQRECEHDSSESIRELVARPRSSVGVQ